MKFEREQMTVWCIYCHYIERLYNNIIASHLSHLVDI